MNKLVPKKRLKPGNWKQNGATPYPLKRRDETVSLAEMVKRNRESFNALQILSGSRGGGNLDDPIRIQRSKSPKNATALQP